MKFFTTSTFRTQLLKASLLAFAAVGVVFSGASSAQLSVNSSSTSQPASRPVLTDGNYLFGQSPNPDEIGAAYAVLSIKDNQTVGAFYSPHSSYDCFSGTITPNRFSVEVVESYTQTVYPYSLAVTVDDSLVAGGGAGAYTLEGFYRINTLSDKDYEMLAVCQADLAQ